MGPGRRSSRILRTESLETTNNAPVNVTNNNGPGNVTNNSAPRIVTNIIASGNMSNNNAPATGLGRRSSRIIQTESLETTNNAPVNVTNNNAPGSVTNNNAPRNMTNSNAPGTVTNTNAPGTVTNTNAPGDAAQPKKKGGRKTAQNNILKAHIDRGEPKPRIEIPIGKTRPLGAWSAQWVAEMGIIGKQNIPATCKRWKDVTLGQKEAIYKKVKDRFTVDLNLEHQVEAVNDSMKTVIRERRHTFHRHYLSIPEGEDKREDPYKSVTQEEWESLCTWFESDEYKKMSARNKNNRKKQKVNHRGGCKSFVRHRYEQRNPETGEEPNQVEFYRNMRWCPQKGWVAPEAAENYERMVELQSQPIEDGGVELTDAEIAVKVLGKRSGYVLGLGHGEVAPSRKKAAYTSEEVNRLRTQNIEQNEELVRLREMSNAQQQMIEEQARKQKEQEDMIEAQRKKQEEQEEFLNAMRQRLNI
ncbi:hypothetical protein ACHQM5_016332 [Ranunculus cassubicifolius]